ncbi:MAG TPA: hypothetical protein VGK60_00940 [Pedococcus sp.]
MRTARLTRAARVAGAGIVMLATAALAFVAAWTGSHRPAPAVPARDPLTRQLCARTHPVTPPARASTGLGGEAASLCPAGQPTGAGWELPGAPLTLERWVRYLREGLQSAPAAPCAVGSPGQPAFTVVVRRIDGARTAYRSTDLACNGREAVARYLAALAYQRADQQAATTTGYELNCSPPREGEAMQLTPPMESVRAAHSAGLLCVYPVFDPSQPGRLTPRDFHSVALTPGQLQLMHRALSTSTFTTTPPAPCSPSPRQVVLHLTTPGDHGPAGEHVDLVGTCTDVLQFDGYSLWWQPPQEVRSTLAGLLSAS